MICWKQCERRTWWRTWGAQRRPKDKQDHFCIFILWFWTYLTSRLVCESFKYIYLVLFNKIYIMKIVFDYVNITNIPIILRQNISMSPDSVMIPFLFFPPMVLLFAMRDAREKMVGMEEAQGYSVRVVRWVSNSETYSTHVLSCRCWNRLLSKLVWRYWG